MMFQAAGSGGELARAAGLQPGRLPCKGSWMRRKAQTEGCIAGWRRKYPARFGRALPDVLWGAWRPGGRGSPEGYLRGRVRHPSAACGDTSPYRGGFWGMRRPAVPGFAARVPYAVGRAFTPAGEACGGGDTAGLCKTPSRKAYESTRPRRRARSPALHCGRKRAATRKWQLSSTPGRRADASIGPYAGVCSGRESTTVRKGIGRAGCGAPPSPAATPPLAGEAFEGGGSPLFPVLRPVCLML